MISLSNRGYPMLRTFIEGGSDFYMSLEEAAHFDQRPFRSMLVRQYIVWRPGRGFHVTKEGREAWNEFQTTEILRGQAYWSRPLTAYFDPAAYGIRSPQPRVHVMPKRHHAGAA